MDRLAYPRQLDVLPKPNSIGEHFLPPDTITERDRRIASFLGGENLVVAFKYGSRATADNQKGVKTDTPTSRDDYLLIVKDVGQFFQDNIDRFPRSFGHPQTPEFHRLLGENGFVYYRFNFYDRGEPVKIKVPVISERVFVDMASAGIENGQQKREPSPFDMYVMGRIQKYGLLPITDVPESVNDAIKQGRINGVAIALELEMKAKRSKTIAYPGLVKRYVGLSYAADIRIEAGDKVKKIIKSSEGEYKDMIYDILEELQQLGVVRLEGQRIRFIHPSFHPDRADNLIKRSKLASAFRNYVVNLASGGLDSGLYYGVQKIKRAFKANSAPVSTVKAVPV